MIAAVSQISGATNDRPRARRPSGLCSAIAFFSLLAACQAAEPHELPAEGPKTMADGGRRTAKPPDQARNDGGIARDDGPFGADASVGKAHPDAGADAPNHGDVADAGVARGALAVRAERTTAVCHLVGPQATAPGVHGSDLGFSFLEPSRAASGGDGRLVFLFGDTWGQAMDSCLFMPLQSDDLQATLPARRPMSLPSQPTRGSAASACALTYAVEDPANEASWRPIRLFADPGTRSEATLLDTTVQRTPITGFSDGEHAYGVFFLNEPADCFQSTDCPEDMVCSTDFRYAGKPIGGCETSLGDPSRAPTFCLPPSFCADGSACVGMRSGICLAEEPYPLVTDAGVVRLPWYDEDPRRAVALNMYIASAYWADRPEDYAVGHKFTTKKFVNPVAQTVRHFDPADPTLNDYREGTHTLLMWGRPSFAGRGGAQAPLFLLYHPLANLLSEDGRIRWAPRFFAGYDDQGLPRWSSRESEAVPVYGTEVEFAVRNGDIGLAWNDPEFDIVNHSAISWVEPLERWVLLYGGSQPRWLLADVATGEVKPPTHQQPSPGAIHMRSAAHPWGRRTVSSPADEAWSRPVPVLTREAAAAQVGCDAAAGPGCGAARDPFQVITEVAEWAYETVGDQWPAVAGACLLGNVAFAAQYLLPGADTGHLYGANIVDSWTEDVTSTVADLEPQERAAELYWNVSTWNPYQVVVMKTLIRTEVPEE